MGKGTHVTKPILPDELKDLYQKSADELICRVDRLAFPIRDDIPVMLEDEARALDPEEQR